MDQDLRGDERKTGSRHAQDERKNERSRTGMKTLGWTAVALVCGFIGGIMLSEVIGIVGYLVFHQAIGIKFLPVYLAVLSGGVTLVVSLLARRRP